MTAAGFRDALGMTAAACTTIAFVPQLVHVWRRKSADDISLSMFLLFCTGVALWLVYGVVIGSFPVIAANLVTLVLAAATLALKVRYSVLRLVRAEANSSGKIET